MFNLLVAMALAVVLSVQAQPRKPFHIGVVHEGGQFNKIVEGLKDGLGELGLAPDADVLLDIRALGGDRAAAGRSARRLEETKVDVLFSMGTSVTIAVKEATATTPIVFVIGGDPVSTGLVKSLSRPSTRLTGVRYDSVELTGKRFEILKEGSRTSTRWSRSTIPGTR